MQCEAIRWKKRGEAFTVQLAPSRMAVMNAGNNGGRSASVRDSRRQVLVCGLIFKAQHCRNKVAVLKIYFLIRAGHVSVKGCVACGLGSLSDELKIFLIRAGHVVAKE